MKAEGRALHRVEEALLLAHGHLGRDGAGDDAAHHAHAYSVSWYRGEARLRPAHRIRQAPVPCLSCCHCRIESDMDCLWSRLSAAHPRYTT
jgi:hypothetical protein